MAILKYDIFLDSPPTGLEDSFISFLNWKDQRASDNDNYAPLYCIHLELVSKTTLALLRIWEHTPEGKYMQEFYLEDLCQLISPFILLPAIKQAIPWNIIGDPTDGMQMVSETLYSTLTECVLLFINNSPISIYNSKIITLTDYENQLRRQCNILKLTSLIYHVVYYNTDSDTDNDIILQLQESLREICPSDDNDNLPDSLSKIAKYALELKPNK